MRKSTIKSAAGRPKKEEELVDVPQTVKFRAETVDRLKELVKTGELGSVSLFVRQAVEHALAAFENPQAAATVRVPVLHLNPERINGTREEGIEGAIELGAGVLSLLDVRPGSFFIRMEDHFMAMIAGVPGDSYVLFLPPLPMQKPKIGDIVLLKWRNRNEGDFKLLGAGPFVDTAAVFKWDGEEDNVPSLKTPEGRELRLFDDAVDIEVVAIGRGMISGW